MDWETTSSYTVVIARTSGWKPNKFTVTRMRVLAPAVADHLDQKSFHRHILSSLQELNVHRTRVHGAQRAIQTCGSITKDITVYQGSVIITTYRLTSMSAQPARPAEKRKTRNIGQTNPDYADGLLNQVRWHHLGLDITLGTQELGEPRSHYKKVLIEM